MAVSSSSSSSSSSLVFFLLISPLGLLSTPGCTFLKDHMTSTAPLEPHFTECLSRDQVTFRCWWSPGSFQNLSSPGALRVFYLKKETPTSEWRECPEYDHANRECLFDVNHTSVWITYCMQLRTQDNITYFNDDDCFTVENIVGPDPPVALNWSLLNMSPSGLRYDIMVHWEPPPSADVRTGWMRVEYEVQYRERNSTNWEALEVQAQNQQTIYGLYIGKEYEVHIHSRMMAFVKFGEFSDSIFIEMTEITSQDSTFPLTLVLTFGIVGVLILIMLIVISQQHRLVMILLPPVPAPKIKGIDPELLKKGKLEELNFIMSGGGIGGLHTYAPDFYQDEPWVEFIEVDAEDAEAAEKEDNQGSDTQRLLGLSQPISHQHTHTGCSNALSFPDDDSGRASCYDPDLPEQETLLAALLPGHPKEKEGSVNVSGRSLAPERGGRPLCQMEPGGPQTWINTDFYAQVSNVMPSGGVVLSPGQQLRIQEGNSATEEDTKKKGADSESSRGTDEEREEKQKELQFQLVVVDPEGSGYTTESNAQQQISAAPVAAMFTDGYQTIQNQPMETSRTQQESSLPPIATVVDDQSPYILPDSPQSQFFAPVSDYTVVQEVGSQHSLLLNPPPQQSPPPFLPQNPLKTLSAMPVGYITPDLLGNLSP